MLVTVCGEGREVGGGHAHARRIRKNEESEC
jgi:hypothetical protein